MKQIIALFTLLITTFSFAQEVKTSEEMIAFNNGSHNAIVVVIPYANRDQIESELKSEMKDWGGKYTTSKGEYFVAQALMKTMGAKAFDGYAKIIENGSEMKVAFAIDLGGAYMNSKEHSAQFKIMLERIKKFGLKTAKYAMTEEMEKESKALKEMESDKKELEKAVEKSKSDIESYKKRISEEEQHIKDNEAALKKNSDEIAKQTSLVQETEKKKNGIHD
jgi:hypothetical protein